MMSKIKRIFKKLGFKYSMPLIYLIVVIITFLFSIPMWSQGCDFKKLFVSCIPPGGMITFAFSFPGIFINIFSFSILFGIGMAGELPNIFINPLEHILGSIFYRGGSLSAFIFSLLFYFIIGLLFDFLWKAKWKFLEFFTFIIIGLLVFYIIYFGYSVNRGVGLGASNPYKEWVEIEKKQAKGDETENICHVICEKEGYTAGRCGYEICKKEEWPVAPASLFMMGAQESVQNICSSKYKTDSSQTGTWFCCCNKEKSSTEEYDINPRYYSEEKYCEKDSDCVLRDYCCEPCYENYVNIYHKLPRWSEERCHTSCLMDCDNQFVEKAACRENQCTRAATETLFRIAPDCPNQDILKEVEGLLPVGEVTLFIGEKILGDQYICTGGSRIYEKNQLTNKYTVSCRRKDDKPYSVTMEGQIDEDNLTYCFTEK